MIIRDKHPTVHKVTIAAIGLPTILVPAYAIYELAIAQILPSVYFWLLVAVTILLLGLIAFLGIKRFMRGRTAARTIAILLAIVLVGTSLFGLTILKRSLDTLDSLTTEGESVSIKTDRSFNVFISGIDTYGDIETASRSDVNIVATVNPDTREVLLTTIPRDSYVKIALGGQDEYDKLTHAGNYGVESSMKTVADLLQTDIDAYVRINFTSFIKSIDKLGGITVDNPTAFSSFGEDFEAGQLYLSGERALVYSRERKSLADGDIDRGKNQQRVIQAIINKITSIRSLQGYNSLLDMIGGSVQTNIDSKTIRSLINQQLQDPSSWTTTSYTLTGKGQTGGLPSFAMPAASLYMFVLDPSSVEAASQQIETTLNKEQPWL